MRLSRKQVIMLIGGVVLVIVIIVVLILNVRPHGTAVTANKLTVWGIEDKATFLSIAGTYPYGTVSYVQLDPVDYDNQVLSALAAGTGPDVFEIGDRSVPRWEPVLAPMPASVAAEFGPLQIAQAFPDVVTQDFVQGGQVYALPLSVDTLAMIYNKDRFNAAGIAIPPATWDEFEADIPKLRTENASGQLIQAAGAIGGSETSMPHATDLLALLMLQNGTAMTNSGMTSATFADGSGGSGLAAFNFYLQFADAASPYYTWNDQMGDAMDSFAAGHTAVIFGYESDLAAIKAKAPFLNIGIAPMPQATGATVPVNYPSYEGFAAAKAGQSSALAWNFIVYLTATEANEKMYVTATGEPPALRTEIAADMDDPNLSIFAAQALTAKSWYEPDDEKSDIIMNAAIQNVLTGADDSTTALNQAQAGVSALF